jgi:hypothetical protein
MKPLVDVLSRDQRHAFVRMQHACQVLADPDAMPRERRSAWVSLFRGFRALERAVPPNRALRQAVDGLSGFVGKVVSDEPTTD